MTLHLLLGLWTALSAAGLAAAAWMLVRAWAADECREVHTRPPLYASRASG